MDYRTPFDGRQQEFSDLTATRPDPDEVPVVRPEFAAECDLNTILNRALPFEARQPSTDLVDFDDNLQDAFAAVAASREAWNKLPRDVTASYRNWLDFAQAAIDGRFRPSVPPADVPSAGGAEAPPAGAPEK